MKRKIVKTVFGMIGLTAFFFASGEAETSWGQVLWSGSMILISIVFIKRYEMLTEEEEGKS